MQRRTLLATGAALAAPRIASAQVAARTLRFVPQSNLASVDPVWSTAVIVRNHGLMIYDTLFGLDAALQPRHQMAQGHEVSSDGLTWTIALREGLRFHDGAPVRSADCIASINRWSKRDVLGQRLGVLLDEMKAETETRFTIRLKRPWSGLAWALGKPSANMCANMPERVAQTDP
ncbi:MAG: ABC transporter substrate-binding protein, partial [Pseudomonadota bacterium]